MPDDRRLKANPKLRSDRRLKGKRKPKKRTRGFTSFCEKVFLAIKLFFKNFGLFIKRAGRILKNFGLFLKRVGVLLKRCLKNFGLFLKRAGVFLKRCLKSFGVFIKRAGVFIKRCLKNFGVFIKRAGVFLKRCLKNFGLFLKHVGAFLKRVFIVIKPALPAVFGGALVFAALYHTGLVRTMAENFSPAIAYTPAVLLTALVSFIPFVSPLLGPGLFIALLAGLLTGEQLAAGLVNPFMLLPALFAIDVQIGNKFIPRFFALGETEPETLNAEVPGIFFTRLITVPAAVTVAYFFSFVVFK